MDRKILVIDDEPMVLSYCKRVFERAGYAVETAGNAEDAISIMQMEPIWVQFVDLGLPGINGVEYCRHVRENWPMAILHAMTGQVSVFQLSDCREAGFDDYFPKPVSPQLLSAAADRAFEKQIRWRK